MQDCIDADVIKLGKYTFFCNPLDSGQKGLSQIGVSFHSASKEIGKKVYEKHVRQENIDIKADLEEECAKIDILSSEIESCLTSILELKDKKQCIKCHAEIDENAVFCPKCGEKQPEIEVKEAEVVTENLENSDVKPENATEAEIVEEKVSGEDNTEREKASEESNSDQQ